MKKHGKHMRQFSSTFFYICLAVLPLLALSCSMEPVAVFSAEFSHIITLTTSNTTQRTASGSLLSDNASVFIYNADNGKYNLDAYYKIDISSGQAVLTSTRGNKKAVLLCNMNGSDFYYENIASYSALKSLYSSFSNENPSAAVLVGELDYNTGGNASTMMLRPLLCRIDIAYFDSDFSGETYNNVKLENPRAYLINCEGFCPILEGGNAPNELINAGEFDYFGASHLAHMEMVYRSKVQGAVLYCYPGNETRLVIEGMIDGHIYYYPIPMSQLGDMRSGTRYVLDILIRRKGTTDPSIDADSRSFVLKTVKMPWKETDSRDEVF